MINSRSLDVGGLGNHAHSVAGPKGFSSFLSLCLSLSLPAQGTRSFALEENEKQSLLSGKDSTHSSAAVFLRVNYGEHIVTLQQFLP